MTIDAQAPEREIETTRSFESLWQSSAIHAEIRVPLLPVPALVTSGAVLAAGAFSLAFNGIDPFAPWLLLVMGIALGWLAWVTPSEDGSLPRGPLVLAGVSGLVAAALILAPEYYFGHEINGIIHRSAYSSLLLMAVGLPAFATSLYYAMGTGPTAWDRSRYPFLLLPIVLAMAAYGAILARLIAEGAPNLSLDLITSTYQQTNVGGAFVNEPGLRNYLLGTLLLVGMTGAIALPIGVGAGAYMAEYDGLLTTVIRFSTLVLRAISVFVLGVTAFTIADWSAQYPPGDVRSDLLRGFYVDPTGFKIAGHGSYVTASAVLAMLVIPVIARATEEGFRSVPREIREGSLALGATEGHGFLRILLPWSVPNIVTGLLLGSAEAAGSVAVLLFVSGRGEFGVGPLRDVTSLSYVVYYADRGPKTFIDVMGQYRYTAALMLIMLTFSFSIAAILIKRAFGRRYESASGL